MLILSIHIHSEAKDRQMKQSLFALMMAAATAMTVPAMASGEILDGVWIGRGFGGKECSKLTVKNGYAYSLLHGECDGKDHMYKIKNKGINPHVRSDGGGQMAIWTDQKRVYAIDRISDCEITGKWVAVTHWKGEVTYTKQSEGC